MVDNGGGILLLSARMYGQAIGIRMSSSSAVFIMLEKSTNGRGSTNDTYSASMCRTTREVKNVLLAGDRASRRSKGVKKEWGREAEYIMWFYTSFGGQNVGPAEHKVKRNVS